MSDQILNDAVLVLGYASARGMLPADSTLPVAVSNAQGSPRVMPADVQRDLIIATNAAAKAMLPMTIDRLRDQEQAAKLTGWARYRYVARRSLVNFFTPAMIYLLCAFLIVIIIAWTMQFNRLAALTAELKATEGQDVVSLLDDAKSAQQELEALRKARSAAPAPAARPGAPAATPTTTAETEAKRAELEKKELALQVKLKKLRELDSNIGIDRRAISQTVDTTTGEPRLWRIVLWTYGLTSLDFSEPRDTPTVVMEAPLPKPPAVIGNQPAPPPPPDPECKNSPPTSDVCAAFTFGRGHGLSITSPKDLQQAYEARRQGEALTILLGTAILPVMYGLLGAGVFLLRGFLGESEANMGIVRPNFAKASLRFGLGGIAGLAIGWFWVPKTGDTTFQTTPFALAFLAGFSIELLFSLLDRILNAVNPRGTTPSQ